MKNLFDRRAQREIVDRICLLKPATAPLWGQMDAPQMLAHLTATFQGPLADKPQPKLLMGSLFGWAMKSKFYDDSAWKKNLPTAKKFKVSGPRDFEKERKELIRCVDAFFLKGGEKVSLNPHPLFGKLTGEQWGRGMYKHIDHHLKQFGV